MKIGSLVSVTWVDTVGSDKEHTKAEALALEPILFTSFGIYLGRSKTKVTIASTQGFDDEQRIYRDITTYPTEVVKKIKEV